MQNQQPQNKSVAVTASGGKWKQAVYFPVFEFISDNVTPHQDHNLQKVFNAYLILKDQIYDKTRAQAGGNKIFIQSQPQRTIKAIDSISGMVKKSDIFIEKSLSGSPNELIQQFFTQVLATEKGDVSEIKDYFNNQVQPRQFGLANNKGNSQGKDLIVFLNSGYDTPNLTFYYIRIEVSSKNGVENVLKQISTSWNYTKIPKK